jgi:hypothetical protein
VINVVITKVWKEEDYFLPSKPMCCEMFDLGLEYQN